MRNFIYGMVTIGLLVASTPGRADVFKCTAEDGGLTFQQTPCPEQKVEKVATQAAAEKGLDCSFANRFADSTARLMRAGVKSVIMCYNVYRTIAGTQPVEAPVLAPAAG